MANVESGRLSRKAPGRRGKKSSKRSAQFARLLEASLETLQKTGWTPEIEAALLDTSALLQIQPQFMDTLVKEARQQQNANVWRLVAEICERRNEDQSAVTYATEALQIQPGDVASMGLLARLCEKRQADTEAADWHRRLLEIESSQIVSHRFLARFHYHRGEYEAALLYLTRLVELAPKSRIDKLYWLLAKIKSEGLLTLAQSLTEVRRWRSFTPEEEPLAHELFVLVGTRCLQSRQSTRAKQYLTRAMQLAPTPEVEALLREVSEQEPTTTVSTQTRPATPLIWISSPPVGRLLELLSTLLNDTRWSRVYKIVTSGMGMIAALIAIALFTVWSMSYTPEQHAFHGFQKEEGRSAEDVVGLSSSKQEVTSPASVPTSGILDPQPTAKKEPSQLISSLPVGEKSAKVPTEDEALTQTASAVPNIPQDLSPSPSATVKKVENAPTTLKPPTTGASTLSASVTPGAKEQPSAPSVDTQIPSVADGLPAREEQPATVSNRAPIREASTASNAITRLSADCLTLLDFPPASE